MKRTFLLILIASFLGGCFLSYRRYTALKSIDSYQKCATDKGSTTQTSYPPTCVTRLGDRFSQTIYGISPILESNGWKKFISSEGYEFSFPSDWQVDDSKYGDDNTKQITIIYRQDNKDYFFTTKAAGRDGPNADKIIDVNITLDGKSFAKRTWMINGKPQLISIITDTGLPFNHIEITVPPNNYQDYLSTIDQILSTFRFTN